MFHLRQVDQGNKEVNIYDLGGGACEVTSD